MKAMKKFTLTVFCILAGCIFFLSGIWIYFQKSLDRVELGEGEHAASYQRHYLMISNDKDTGMWQSVYESASKEAEEKDAYVELLSPEQMNGYSQADCLKIGIASQVDGIILEADGSKEEQHLITEALKDGIPVVTVMTDDTATSRISFVGLNSYQMGSAYTEQIQGFYKCDVFIDIQLKNAENKSCLFAGQKRTGIPEKNRTVDRSDGILCGQQRRL